MQKVGMVITHAIKFFLLISLILFSFVCFPCGSIVTDSFEVSLEFFPVAQLEEIWTRNAKFLIIQIKMYILLKYSSDSLPKS